MIANVVGFAEISVQSLVDDQKRPERKSPAALGCAYGAKRSKKKIACGA